MPGTNIESILGHTALGRVIEAVKPGIPDPLPEAFRDRTKSHGIRQEYRGKGARFIRVKGQRKTAQRTEYGSPAVRRVQLPIEEVNMIMLHSFHELEPFDWLLLQRLRSYEAYDQRGAAQEVTRQVEGFADLFENLEIASTIQALSLGFIHFDQNGNLLPSSSGATLSVDYQIPAGNRNQVSGIISASWATAATNIEDQIRLLKLHILKLTGYRPKYAFYGKNIPGYLFRNTVLQNYFVRHPEIRERYVSSNEIGSFLDLIWVPMWESFYVDSSDVVQETWGADTVVFTPEPSINWWEFATGSYGVPKSFGPTMDAAAALGQIDEVFGRFAYAVPDHNPPSVTAFAGNTWMPFIKVPDAVIIADVTP